MPTPLFSLQPFSQWRNLAAVLVPNDAPDFLFRDDESEWQQVLVCEGDLTLKALDLDSPLEPLSELAVLSGCSLDKDAYLSLLVVHGSLTVTTIMHNRDTSGGCGLLVTGTTTAHDMVLGGSQGVLLGDVVVQRLLWCDDNDGYLYAARNIAAQLALFSREYTYDVKGEKQYQRHHDEWWTKGTGSGTGAQSTNEIGVDSACTLFPAMFVQGYGLPQFNGDTLGGMMVSSSLRRDAVVQSLLQGQFELVDASLALPPLAQDVCPDNTISIANIKSIMTSGLHATDEPVYTDWCGEMDFQLSQHRIDEDGDQRDDTVFITLWKRYDLVVFVNRVATPVSTAPGFFGLFKQKRTEMRESLAMAYRRYDASGKPLTFEHIQTDGLVDAAQCEALMGEAHWKNAQFQWRTVLDYARKAAAQTRAGYPLMQQALREITPEKIEQLAALHIFQHVHNDLNDEDKNGYWEDDLYLQMSQPEGNEQTGEDYVGAMLALKYALGEEQAGDEDGDAIASFIINVMRRENGALGLDFRKRQRQDGSVSIVEPNAADDWARLLRWFATAQSRLLAREDERVTAKVETDRVERLAVLGGPNMQSVQNAASLALSLADLSARPAAWANGELDAQLFSPELLALSDAWQSGGKAYIAQMRALQKRSMQAGQEGLDPTEDDVPPEQDLQDPRKALAPVALQLARAVSAQQHEGLQRRFRERFSFPSDAYIHIARKHGQTTSQLFVQNDGSVLVRIGNIYNPSVKPYFAHIVDTQVKVLRQLEWLGRSNDRQCWAVFENGVLSTRKASNVVRRNAVGDLLTEPQHIATFALPTGREGVPDCFSLDDNDYAGVCEQLIPFNDGQKVLLRNLSGIYLLQADQSVTRLHPLDFDEDDADEFDTIHISMAHMALSPCERYIALGSQDSQHIVLSAQGNVLHTVAPQSDYPHAALFSPDGDRVVFNACHLYSGLSIIVPSVGTTPASIGGDADFEPTVFESMSRVYVAHTVGHEALMGNAEGYIQGKSFDDTSAFQQWWQHIGSSLDCIDSSADGRTVYASSCAGYVVRLQRCAIEADEHSSGCYSPFKETRRWIFWDSEPQAIVW